MPYHQESDEYPAYDDEWDADEEAADYLAIAEDSAAATATDQVLIIPGEGLAPAYGLLPRRKRPLAMQMLLVAISACLMTSIAFSFIPLADISQSAAINPFSALVNVVNLINSNSWVLYHAHSGDTFTTIATAFGLTTP